MSDKSRRQKLEMERSETLSEIHDERSSFESMVQRARIAGKMPPDEFVREVLDRLDEIAERARTGATIDEVLSTAYDADQQGQLRAYVCPLDEIEDEGNLAIDSMEEWKVPPSVLEKLRRSLLPKLERAKDQEATARGALRAIFEENDSWARYTNHYEHKMRSFSRILFWSIVVLIPAALVSFHWRETFLFGLFFGGAAGSCASVISKMPLLAVGLSGELESYERRILSRVSVGIVASLIGCALLGWGILSIFIQNQSFSDVINACSTGIPCTKLKLLILLSVPMLFGFSERALTSFEQQFFGQRN
jgi:hypothetical protein